MSLRLVFTIIVCSIALVLKVDGLQEQKAGSAPGGNPISLLLQSAVHPDQQKLVHRRQSPEAIADGADCETSVQTLDESISLEELFRTGNNDVEMKSFKPTMQTGQDLSEMAETFIRQRSRRTIRDQKRDAVDGVVGVPLKEKITQESASPIEILEVVSQKNLPEIEPCYAAPTKTLPI